MSWIWMHRQLYAIPGLSAGTTLPPDDTSVEAIGLYMAKTRGVAISVLTLAKASSWSGPQDQVCLVLRSSLRGLECEAICGEYLPN